MIVAFATIRIPPLLLRSPTQKFPPVVKYFAAKTAAALSNLTVGRGAIASCHMKRMTDQSTTFRLAFAVAICLAFSPVSVQAAASETSEGERLERQMA